MPTPEILASTPTEARVYTQLRFYRVIRWKNRKCYNVFIPCELINGYFSPNKKFCIQLADVKKGGVWQRCIILNLDDYQNILGECDAAKKPMASFSAESDYARAESEKTNE